MAPCCGSRRPQAQHCARQEGPSIIRLQGPERCLTSQLRCGLWGQHQAPLNPSKTQEGLTPRGEAGAPDCRATTLALQNDSKYHQMRICHLQAQANSHRNQGVFPEGKSAKYGQFFLSPSQSDWLGVSPRKYKRSKQTENENLC